MMRSLIRCGALAGVIALGACSMDVQNPNDPGKERVANTPEDLENFLGTQYRRWHDAFHRSLSNTWGMMNVQSFENFSSLANNCMAARISIPRPANDNTLGNGCSEEQARTYFIHSEVARGAANVLAKLDGAGTTGFTFGTEAQDFRARAMAEFLRGLSLGYIALFYDSGGIIRASDPVGSDGNPESVAFVSYQELMTEALVALENAVTAANAPASGINGFPLPVDWLRTPTSMTAANFTRLVRSYAARLRANVARSPVAAADSVDWVKVRDDALAGLQSDFLNTTSTTTGPGNTWIAQLMTFTTWHQMSPFILGMADTSGAYLNWLNQPLSSRGATAAYIAANGNSRFILATPDQRFPQGATRAAQQADFDRASANTLAPGTACDVVAPAVQFPNVAVGADALGPAEARGSWSLCKRYFQNRRAGDDNTSGNSWGLSNYNHVRFFTWQIVGAGGTAQNGTFPFFTRAEVDLLAAEAHYMLGDYASAALLINRTRVRRGGLQPIVAFDAVSPVPGEPAGGCVPNVPSNAGSAGGTATLSCGTMLEALKWEKRLETQYTHPGAWFLDSRRWGDLAQGTGLHYAPPYQELQARGRIGTAIYSTGGPTNEAVAPGSNYGW